MHWFMLLMIGVLMLQAGAGGGIAGVGLMTATMIILILSILFHEFGHCWMAIRQGGHAEKILLWPLGGLSYVDYEHGAAEQIKVAGIGPLSSLLLSAAFFGILVATGVKWTWSLVLPYEGWRPLEFSLVQVFILHAARLNLLLGLFNLCVPAYPLDGGQVLFGLLTLKFGRLRAANAMVVISIPIGIALALFGFSAGLLMLGLIGLNVVYEAFQLRHLIRIGELEAHPAFRGPSREFDYMPDKPKKKGWLARWRENRARKAMVRDAEHAAAERARVDIVLEKVSREGIGSLSAAEKKILDDASRRGRGE
jgi:Zn-dependent protease